MHEKIHFSQLAIIVYMIQSGITLFSLPRIVAEGFGRNGWLIVFVISCIVLINIYLIVLVYQKGNGKSVFQLLENGLPKIILYPLYLFIIGLFSILAVLVGKSYVILVQTTMFPDVSLNILLILYLLVAWFIIIKGIYNISKITIVFFFLTVWTLFLVWIVTPEFELIRLTPFFLKGDLDIFHKGIEIYAAFLGYEIVLFLIPYVGKEIKFSKAIIAGHLFTTMIYVIVCFISFGFYSFEQLLNTLYPTITATKYIQTPLIERIEHLTFSFFLMKIVITSVFYYWVAIEVIDNIVPAAKKKKNLVSFLLIFFTFLVSLTTEIQREISELFEWLTIPEIIFAFVFPILLLVAIAMQNSTKQKGDMNA